MPPKDIDGPMIVGPIQRAEMQLNVNAWFSPRSESFIILNLNMPVRGSCWTYNMDVVLVGILTTPFLLPFC